MRGALLTFALAVSCAAQAYRIETVAGSGQPGFSGDRANAFRAQFDQPTAVILDASGRLYIADSGNNRVRRIEINGTVTTVAGNGDRSLSGDGGSATDASFLVAGIALDSTGTLYIAGGTAVRTVTAAGVAGTLAAGFTDVTAIAAETAGTFAVIDAGVLRRVAADGTISEIATGIPEAATAVAATPDRGLVFLAGERLYRMDPAGAVTPVPLETPPGPGARLTVDRAGEIHISGTRIWKLAGDRAWVLAGTDTPGFSGDGGAGVLAQVNAPGGMAVDPAGNIYFADTGNHRIRLLRAPFSGSISAVTPAARSTEIWPRGITLRWTPLANAATYDVWFGTDAAALTRVATVDAPEWTPPALAPRTTYFWRITTRFLPLLAVNSPIFSFTTTTVTGAPPVPPAQPQPFSQSTGVPASLWLSWRGTGAASYEIYVDENEYVVQRAGFSQEQRFFVRNLKPNTKYYWRVLAINDRGQEYSARWEFTTGPAAGYPWLIETVAGTPLPVADGLLATEAVIDRPRLVAVGPQGEIYFTEARRRVRRIDPDGRLRAVWTPAAGEVTALATDSAANVYIALAEYVVRISRTGVRTILAGQPGRRGFSGDSGPGTQALLNGVTGVAADRRGNIFIADSANNRIRAVASTGVIRTYAGTGSCDNTDAAGTATATPLCAPSGIAADPSNNLYVTLAGGWVVRLRTDNFAEPVVTAQAAAGVAADAQGNVYLLDSETMTIRRAGPDGTLTDFAGEPDFDGRAFGFAGDGLPAARARFAFPEGLAFDTGGNLLLADTGNNRIRRIDTNGFVSTVAGTDTARGDRGPASAAWLYGPTDVAVDDAGTVFIADSGNNRIRRVGQNRFLDTVAGGGADAVEDARNGAARVGRRATELRIDLATGGLVELDESGSPLFTDGRFAWLTPDGTEAVFALDLNGILTSFIDTRVRKAGGIARGISGETYVSDTLGHRILRIDADGTPTVLAGTGAPGFTGDGGPAAVAQVNAPRALSISPDGELFIAEFGRVRKIAADGRIVTVVNEHAGGLAHDRFGRLFLTAGRSVFVLSESGTTLARIAGRDSAPAGLNEGGPALDTRLNDPQGIAVSRNDEVIFADAADHLVRRLVPNLPSSMTAVSGDGQTIVAGQPATRLQVRVAGRTGRPVAGIPVTFTLSGGTGAALPFATVNTAADGLATVIPFTAGRTGALTITASTTGVQSVTFRITAQ